MTAGYGRGVKLPGKTPRRAHHVLRGSDTRLSFAIIESALCASVAGPREESGLDLLTYYDLPKPMWKSLRLCVITTGQRG